MATNENLKDAFAGESRANRRYLAFAKKAEADGFPQVARLFRAVAEAETIHAHAHLRVLKGVGATADNLREAQAGEAYEFQSMYPPYVAAAEEEKNKAAQMSFKFAMAVEKTHHALYGEALAAVSQGKDLNPVAIWICTVCGHTVSGSAPDNCPVCKAARTKYVEVK